ncbi:MAG: hypothetical protein ETSY1_15390 [Candidatus Entotheonella factor]|uniref:Uncharacterized protein n=1 Tax=Entotheonella factor TaxID=1429438 RepID=W4LN00_ENTF1|nr:MAG: hypothetical protein ETSY1_15390 [Candidatus Entotheonella factor]
MHEKPTLKGPKKFLFWGIVLIIPFCFVAAIEGVARFFIAIPVGDDPFLNIGAIPSFFDTTRINGKPHYRVVHSTAYRSRNIVFPVEKDKNTLRIFCLGGSASAGWPHPKSEIYSAYLEQALQVAYPDRDIEVVNISAHAYASYRIKMIFENVIEYDPDLIVIYSGNNEFLERRTYLKHRVQVAQAEHLANHSVAFRYAQFWYQKKLFPESSLSGLGRERIQYEMWSKVAKVTLTLRKDPEQFEYLKRHYHYNIEQIVKKSNHRGVPVVLVTVPTNVHDWYPNVSYHRLSGEDFAVWQTYFDQGQREILQNNPNKAIEALQKAIEMEPLHAESYFYLARAYEINNEPDHALKYYYQAKDLDYNPFRAISAFNRSLHDIATSHPHAYLADADQSMVAVSFPVAPGFDLFLDYVHPTKKGNLVIAETVFDTILDHRIFGEPSGATQFVYEPEPLEDGKLYDEHTDYVLQETILWLFGMMHQYEGMASLSLKYTGPDHPEIEFITRVKNVFPDYVELRKKKILGENIKAEEEQKIKDQVIHFYGNKANEYPRLSQETVDKIF